MHGPGLLVEHQHRPPGIRVDLLDVGDDGLEQLPLVAGMGHKLQHAVAPLEQDFRFP